MKNEKRREHLRTPQPFFRRGLRESRGFLQRLKFKEIREIREIRA